MIPHDLAPRLHETLRRHFAEHPEVEVITERRGEERRTRPGRRAPGQPVPADASTDRRRLVGEEGRRVADRRSPAVVVDGLPLPRRAAPTARAAAPAPASAPRRGGARTATTADERAADAA
jgi:hypothetical protein